ncbi:MAG: hypothetical protein K5659_07710 [Lachnospiraceae bacterium]|nr:hypothetical protein [Lachnospiraceae bacterium]
MKEVEYVVDLEALQKEIDERNAEEDKKKKSNYYPYTKLSRNVGSGIRNSEGEQLLNDSEYMNLVDNASEEYPEAFQYDYYDGTFCDPMGGGVKITPGTNVKNYKKWVKDAKKINDKIEKYIDDKASSEEISEEYAETYKAITTDRINRTLDGYSDEYISGKTPLGMVNCAIDACSTSELNKESSEIMAKWNRKFPLWSYYKTGEKQLRTLTEYWKDKEKNKGELSLEKEDKYRKQLYESTVKMINYQQKMLNAVVDPTTNKQLVDDNVFDRNNNPYHIHPYSARGITASYKTHETYKACLENGWAIDDIALVAAFSTYLSYTESCVMSKRSAISLDRAEFRDEPLFSNDPKGLKVAHYKKAVELYEKIKTSRLSGPIEREKFIKEMTDIINEAREKKLYFVDGANNTSTVFNYFDQVKKDVDYRTKMIAAGKEYATFATDFTKKTKRDTELFNAVNTFNTPRSKNRESDEHKELREAVEDLQALIDEKLNLENSEKTKKKIMTEDAKKKAKSDPEAYKELTLEQIDKISIFNSEDAAFEYAGKYLSKLDEVVYKSRAYQKEKDGTSSTIGQERLKGARDIEKFAKKEENRLLKDFVRKGYLPEGSDLSSFRNYVCTITMKKAVNAINKFKAMPQTPAEKKEFNSLVADVIVSKLANVPSDHPLIDIMGSNILKQEILKSSEFKGMMKDFYKDKTMTPSKVITDIEWKKKMLDVKSIKKTASAEKQHRIDKAKDSYNKVTKNIPKPKK